MEIRQIFRDKKRFLPLLLLADEQENMVDRYLSCGEMFALCDDGKVKTIAVITREGEKLCELKNIATVPAFQGQGFGKKMIEFLCNCFQNSYDTMYVGTGESPLTIPFYHACGFRESHRVKNFFTDYYDHPIWECGVQLTDMVYLKRDLRKK